MSYQWHQAIRTKLTQARQAKRLPHAILFAAETGCGHEAFIPELAQSLLCLDTDNAGVACGNCRSCEVFQATAHPDFVHIKTPDDKNVITVEQIRGLNNFLELSRSYSPVRVALISEAEAMNVNAANSLLKTLEEPVSDTHILLLTHHAGSLLPTIRSRCQQIRMPLPAPDEAIAWLEQGGHAPTKARSLLTLASGRPLYAVELADGQLAEQQALWLEQLLDIMNNKRAIADVSVDWGKQDKTALLDWQIRLVSQMLRANFATEDTPESALSGLMTAKDLWALHDALLQLKALATHPLNTQLFAENMLSLWQK